MEKNELEKILAYDPGSGKFFWNQDMTHLGLYSEKDLAIKARKEGSRSKTSIS